MSNPVVLIAEELSPATVEALGPDFEIRHCNGADRAELLTAIADVDAILIRSATKVNAEALGGGQESQGGGPGGRRSRQRRREGGNAERRHGRERSDLQHRQRSGDRSRPHARGGPAHQPRARGASQRRMEALEVHRHRAVREDPRHRRPRPHRRTRCSAAQRLRHEGHRLRSLRPSRPRRADGRPPGRPRHPAHGVGLHVGPPAQDPGNRRSDRCRGVGEGPSAPRAGQRCPWRHRRRGRAVRRAEGRPPRGRRTRRLRDRAVHGQPALRTRERRRHAAPRRVDRRGAGEGWHLGREVGPTGVVGRPGSGCRQCAGWRDRRRRAPGHSR